MPRTDTIVIGGGQAGLAVSRCLSDAGRDHVVLERGRTAESWRTQRWDSLRLLTPNWMTRLPGWSYAGDEPDGFMPAAQLVAVLERYAHQSAAPVEEHTTVEAVHRSSDGWTVRTDQGTWRGAHVVVATGHCMRPAVPPIATGVAPAVDQLTADRYRNPGRLPDGGVLVVGASATGIQIAEELAASGRDVVLAVGAHTRMPRRYRRLDTFRWLQLTGMLADRRDAHPDPDAATESPSLQLVGSNDHRDLDLGTCQAVGVQLVGRLVALDGTRATFAPDLASSVAAADARMHRTLDRFDRHAAGWYPSDPAPTGLGPAGDRPAPVRIPAPVDTVDLVDRGIGTILWATGYRRAYPWLPDTVLDRHGEIRQQGGIGATDGLYTVGLRFQRHRASSFVGGVGADARFVAEHLTGRRAPAGELAA